MNCPPKNRKNHHSFRLEPLRAYGKNVGSASAERRMGIGTIFNFSILQRIPQRQLWDFDRMIIWLVVSTHLKNISQIGNLPQIGMKIKNI